MSFKGLNFSKLAKGLIFYDLKRHQLQGYIHVYYHSSQNSLFVYISGLR